MSIPDNYSQWEARDRDQNRWLESLPKCKCCEEPIQQEMAYHRNGEWICDACLENCREEVET